MFDYFSGKLANKNPTEAVLDVNGIGYHFLISLATFSALPEPGSHCRLFVHLQVREDAQQLYGFVSEFERMTFRLLISVSGIGPKLGVTVLSGVGPEKLQEAIASADVTTLTRIPGIGKKTAERLVVELKEKISHKMKATGITRIAGFSLSVFEDAISALLALGYKRPEAEKAVSRALEQSPEAKVEKVIREALGAIR